MVRKSYFVLLLVLVIFSCRKVDAPITQQSPDQDLVSRAEIDELIRNQLNQGDVFHWDKEAANVTWSAAVLSDSILSIGYKPAKVGNIDDIIHELDLTAPDWVAAKERILDRLLELERQYRQQDDLTLEDLIVFGDYEYIPVINIQIASDIAVKELRAMDEVRYVEPLGYYPAATVERSGAGCSEAASSNVPSADYSVVSPSAKVPWNFFNQNIPTAWNRSTGRGVKIAIIDTGTYPSQARLNGQFNSGQSTGRTLQRAGTYRSSIWPWARPDGPDDRCGHGTQMCGAALAPRSTTASVGVAYNANLLSIRGTADVLITSSRERAGVSDALVLAGNDSGVRIISMSIGNIFSIGQVADAVRFANGRGKMIFAAAGTSFSFTNWVGVVFPASMSETVAVTGVTDRSSLRQCAICHYGSRVDFVAVMQRDSDSDRTSLTLARSGLTPGYVGGSSVATAMTAGIAALVMSRYPNESNASIYNRLRNASSLYPSRSNRYGWGIVDAAAAVN